MLVVFMLKVGNVGLHGIWTPTRPRFYIEHKKQAYMLSKFVYQQRIPALFG